MNEKIEIGGLGRDNYICNKSIDDIVILGSSRAVHHYNPCILEDSLQLSCYNAGEDGNGILLSYARLKMLNERHHPKIVLYDFIAAYDFLENDNHTYLGWLKNRYNRTGIYNIFKDVDETECIKMFSYLYRYNTRFLQNSIVYLTGISTDSGIKGFRPLEGNMDELKIKYMDSEENIEYDELKLRYLRKMITENQYSELIFVYSPIWYGDNISRYDKFISLCKKYRIPVIDFSNNPKYVHNNDYFVDAKHLNSNGADEFTRDLINELGKLGYIIK